MALGNADAFPHSYTVNVTFVDPNFKNLYALLRVDGANVGLTDEERDDVARGIASQLIDLRPNDTVQEVTVVRTDSVETTLPFTP